MGIRKFVKGELLEIIEWTDATRDTLSFRFPDEDKAIKRGASLIVRESQAVQFVYLGEFGDTFGPGKHRAHRPTTSRSSPASSRGSYGFESPFKADVYYINTRLFTGQKWGTSNPIMMRDDDFGDGPGSLVRHRTTSASSIRRSSCARWPAPITISSWRSSTARCAHA